MRKKNFFIIGIFLFFVMVVSFYFFNKGSYASDYVITEEDIELQRKAVVEVANAFYEKGINIQYDTFKRWFNFAPEDATDDSTVYSVCSVFVQAVYYHALGIEVPNYTQWLHSYAADKNNNEFLVKYYTKDEYLDLRTNKKDKFLKDLLSVIKPGDILTIKGHTQLIVSVGTDEAYILESTGKNGNRDDGKGIDAYETSGTIKKSKFTTEVLSGGKGTFSIIRPIANGKYFRTRNGEVQNIKITNSALTRLKYTGIDIDKTGSSGTNSYVNFNDEIEYKIKITNNSENKYDGLSVVEKISNLVDVVDNGNGVYNNGTLTWNNLSIDAGKSLTISYKVKVKEISENYKKEIISEGYVGDIKTATVVNTIGYILNDEEQQKIVNSLTKLKSSSGKSGLSFVNEVYKDAFNVDLKISDLGIYDFITDKELATLNDDMKSYVFLDAYNTYNNSYWFRKGNTFRDGTTRSSAYFFDVDYWNTNYSQYIKIINLNSFKVGDVILSYDDGALSVWFCMGKNKFMKITSSSKTIVTDHDLLVRVFSEIFYKESFVALNPALLLQNNLSSIKVDNVKIKDFTYSNTEYKINVDSDVDSVSLDAIAIDSTNKITGDIGEKHLDYGDNAFKISSTNSIGTTKTYNVNIYREIVNSSTGTEENQKSSNCYLSELNLSYGNINFDKNVLEYKINVLYNVDEIDISAKTEVDSASYEIVGNKNLNVGNNIITVRVVAEDGSIKEYKINIIKNDNIVDGNNKNDNTDDRDEELEDIVDNNEIDNPETGDSIIYFGLIIVIILSGILMIYYSKQYDV